MTRCSAVGGAGMLALAIVTSSVVSARAAPPKRIVSLNVCVDQILLDLVPHDRIAAVTHLATDPLTVAHPGKAKGIPSTKGASEDVLALDPDLVVAGAYTTPATVAVLRRVGRRVEVVTQPQTIDGIRALVRDLARLVEEPQRGEALVRQMNARIAAVQLPVNATQTQLSAIVYQVNNHVSAAGSLIDEAMALAGLRNGAEALRLARHGPVGIEVLLTHPPDLLILASGPSDYRTAVADNLRHPALVSLVKTIPTVVVPWPLWLCGTHHIADVVERLAALPR